MSFLRKASLNRKKDRSGSESPKAPSVRSDKPPRSRAVSDVVDDDGGKPKRKVSLSGKGRKRLSSLFSSSSLSSFNSDRDPASSPSASLKHSNLNISTSSSGASTPTRESSIARSYNSLHGKGTPPDTNGTADAVARIQLHDGPTPLHESPESSPVSSTTPGPPHGLIHSQGPEQNATTRAGRTPSLYSQWDLAEAAEQSSDDEDEAFLTPDEGLSEVEEEDEEEPVVPNKTLDKTNVQKGAMAEVHNTSGTGQNTVIRSKPTHGETRVRRRVVTKAHADSIDQAAALGPDLDICREILRLFLTSQMKEAEDMCFEKDPDGNHLYLISAHGIINALKGMMTFDSDDLANALEICKATSMLASTLRRPSDSIVTRLGGFVRSGAGVARVKAMTPLERHAELAYAETSLMKAMIAIIAGGDWLGLVREALNMRTAHGIYRTLQQFQEEADKNGYDDDLDMDFRSGVLLGTGTSSLMLSLLPGKVLKIAEVFGYAGDRKFALESLMAAGGWSTNSAEPSVNEANEGLRRPICDMILLAFHLVISLLMPVDGVDIKLARNILNYNMKRYPDGVFFLYFQARLRTSEAQPEEANKSLQRALDLKLEYVQLQHMCLWDFALNYLQLANWKGSLDCFSILKDESNWSRATYTYAAAACLVELNTDGNPDASLKTADELMKSIPKLTKKIAGKSLPIEKLCSRKARKFESQGHRLFLPAVELAYVFGALSFCPRRALLGNILPRIDAALAKLEAVSAEDYGNGHGYWDDYCLGHFLRGFVLFIARYQPSEAAKSAFTPIPNQPAEDELDHAAEKDFSAVLRHAPQVELDHHIIYHCHYELGRLYARRGDNDKARKNFDVVMSGKLPEVNQFEKKSQGKYSLEGALLLKTHAALSGLQKGQAV